MGYIIDFSIYVGRFIPVKKRNLKHLAFLKVLVEPLNGLNSSFFSTFFVKVKDETKRNGQKIILENTLNVLFNAGNAQKIVIDNAGDDLSTEFFYNELEGYPAIFFSNEGDGGAPLYLYRESEYIGKNDFKVIVPSGVVATYPESQIKFQVNKYKPAGTSGQIILI